MQLTCISQYYLGAVFHVSSQCVAVRVRANEFRAANKPLRVINAGADAGPREIFEVAGNHRFAVDAASGAGGDSLAGRMFRLLFECRGDCQYGRLVKVGQTLDPGNRRCAKCQRAGLVKNDMGAACECLQAVIADG